MQRQVHNSIGNISIVGEHVFSVQASDHGAQRINAVEPLGVLYGLALNKTLGHHSNFAKEIILPMGTKGHVSSQLSE